MTVAQSLSSCAIDIEGMTCAGCAAHVRKTAESIPGVRECRVNLARGSASVQFDSGQITATEVARAISDAGYDAVPRESSRSSSNHESDPSSRQRLEEAAWFRRAVIGLLLWLPIEIAHWLTQILVKPHHAALAQQTVLGWVAFALSTISMIYVASRFYRSAWRALRHRTSNMDTLISMGASVAYGYSLIYFVGGLAGAVSPPTLHQLYFIEASGLLALISLGHWLEARARQSAGSAIHALLNLSPPTALKLDERDQPREVRSSDLQVGDRVLVRPGDRVPADGVVIDGRSSVDESMISGEPLPVPRERGQEVIGGTINVDGRLVLRVSKTGSATTLAQIIELVERAQSSKPPVQKLADKVAGIFVPAVLLIALVTGIGWYSWAAAHGWSAVQTWGAIANACCSVLIIACPCALGLAVPAALMVGLGRGARHGILIRDIDALQKAERIETIVLDKTGTVTAGRPVFEHVTVLDGTSGSDVLRLAAAAEQYSEHPLARAIVAEARRRNLPIPQPRNFTNEPGLGVVAQVEERKLIVGSPALLQQHGVPPSQPEAIFGEARSLVHVAQTLPDGRATVLGLVSITDQLKPDSIRAVQQLHQMNLRTVLLTGDNQDAATAVSRQVGIDEVHAQVRPADKAKVIAELQRSSAVAMVGDGINDAPALAQADLGIAIGSGSDVAKEAGDIVLSGGSLAGVPAAILLSRATMRKIRQNLFFAFIYNVLAIPLAAFGLLNPLIAAAAMALSDLTVIGNALLLRRSKIGDQTE